jgi:hypothetical protein
MHLSIRSLDRIDKKFFASAPPFRPRPMLRLLARGVVGFLIDLRSPRRTLVGLVIPVHGLPTSRV